MRRTALITGATGGLGGAFAWEFAAQGWDLLLTDRSQDALRLLADGIARAHGSHVETRVCDLEDEDDLTALAEWAAGREAHIGGLVNVAGFDVEGAFLHGDPRRLLALMRVNMEAGVLLTHALAGAYRHWEPLRVINTASLAAFYPMPYKALYSASKRFVLNVSLALREELRGLATVTTLCPAGMPTTPATIAAIADQGFFGRITTMNASEVAHRTYCAALAGRPVVVPGVVNQLMLAVSRLLPATMLAAAIGRRWGNARGFHGAPAASASLVEAATRWPAGRPSLPGSAS